MFYAFYSMASIPMSILFLTFSLLFCGKSEEKPAPSSRKGKKSRKMRRRDKSPPGSDEGHESGRDSKRSGKNLADQWGLNDPQPGDEEIKTDLDGIRDDNPLTRMKIRTKTSTVTATPGEEERKRLLAERQRKSNERQWKADKKQHSKKES
ncbi:unnamed protein product, partial [Mesorhabditis spiculigera]